MMNRTLIIAEAGVNHNGDVNLAKKLIDAAAEAGADYVKFQTFRAEELVVPSAGKAAYQQANQPSGNDSQLDMLKRLELSQEDHFLLSDYCSQKGIEFLSTAFDLESLHFLHKMGISLAKIPSGEITNYPYLREVARLFSTIILSTGMSDVVEIEEAISVLCENGATKENITVLHCNTEYPTPMQDVNLKAMQFLFRKLDVKTGYSDHTVGIEVPIAAVALGASVIEKHFTLSREMEGPDHKASLEPHELKAMVAAIRNIEQALGVEDKFVTESELKNKAVARKSIVAARYIKAGEVFYPDNLACKRPGTGISPMRWEQVLGRTASRDFQPNEQIEL